MDKNFNSFANALERKIEAAGANLKELSLKAGRNHSYLQQFLKRGSPRTLPQDVRTLLSEVLGGHPDDYLGVASMRSDVESDLRATGPVSFDVAALNIVEAGHLLDAKNMAPATSGNYSMRLGDGSFAVTASGFHKGRLVPDNIMRVDGNGKALEPKKPSAETLLHTQIYRHFPDANAILHVHSTAGVVLTRWLTGDIVLEGYEMLKIFPGIDTHAVRVVIHAVNNTQDMPALCETLEPAIGALDVSAYIIRDHGFYVWGKDMETCVNMCEAMDHMLTVEVELLKLRAGAR